MKNDFVLHKSLVLFMAVVCGITVANLYYMQPLLSQVGSTFHVSQSGAGALVTITQVGYAFGLFFFVPLGDIRERRMLIVKMLLFVVVSLLAVSFSISYGMLLVSCFLVGFTTIVPQLIIPYAAHLSEPDERGKIIGIVTSGLLIGILLSRTFSGLLGSTFGWRKVYLFAAVLILILAFFIRKLFPASKPASKIAYKDLLISIGPLIRKQRVLRESSINGALMFGSFSAFWTSLIFLLETPTYKMGAREAGLFGLFGITGALAAPIIGKLADKKSPRFTVGIGIIFASLSYICFLFLGFKLWGLMIGVVLLDLGNQNGQVSNQARVQALGDEIRSRNNTVFMVSYFAGGALGSFLGTLGFQHFGWYGVCFVGITFQILAVIFHFLVYKKAEIN